MSLIDDLKRKYLDILFCGIYDFSTCIVDIDKCFPSIPNDWNKLTIGDLNLIPTGIKQYEGEKDYYSTGTIGLQIPEGTYTFENRPARANRYANLGDVIEARMMNTSKATIIDSRLEGSLLSTGFFQIGKSEKYIQKYIYYYLQSNLFIKQKDKLCTGVTQKSINDRSLQSIIIPIPCKEKQEEIVDKIDYLFNLLNTKDKNDKDKILLKKSLKMKILDDAIHGNLVSHNEKLNAKNFVKELISGRDKYIIKNKLTKSKESNTKNNLFDIPNNWCWTTLGDICFVTKLAGFEYTKDVAPNLSETGEVPVVRAQNIKPNCFVDDCQEFISMDLSKKLYRCALDCKCVLMTFIGAGIGEVAVFENEKRYHLAPNVAKIVPPIDINKYIMYYLMSKDGKKNVFDYKKSVAQASLSMETIRNVAIPMPPLEELNRIVEKIDNLFKLIEQL